MHQEQAKAWRLCSREQHEEESVNSIVAFLEERIRELHIAPQKAKSFSNVYFTDATGGQSSSAPVQTNSKPPQFPSKPDKYSSEQEKKKTKRRKRLDRIRCFKWF
ncbi:hypothetical protein ACKWTF_007559 [Chironomus riparius]